MDYQKIAQEIKRHIAKDPHERETFTDLLSVCRQMESEDFAAAHAMSRELCALSIKSMQTCDGSDIEFFYAMYKRGLLFNAPHSFDAYLRYVEIERKPEKRFYAPRAHYLRPMIQGFQDVLDGRLRLLTISMPKRAGKLLAHDTPVLTPGGFKKHGELKVGDYVFGIDGKPKRVTYRHPDSYATHKVRFSNGEEILTSAEHEWLVFDKSRNKQVIVETQDMLDSGLKTYGNRWRYLIPAGTALDMPHKPLPVEPYTLGAWLGDGTTTKPLMTNAKSDRRIIYRMIADGYPLRSAYIDKNYGTLVVTFTNKLSYALRSVGMCNRTDKGNKYIPEEYFTASVEQRLNLLAGLIDTDGYIEKGKHRVSISTVLPRLRDDIVRLVSTFGWDVRYCGEEPKVSSSGITGRHTCWIIHFAPDIDIPTVLARKKISPTTLKRNVSVRSIERLETPIIGNCITVEGGLYRAGYRQVVTHNSQTGINFVNMMSGKFPNKSTLMEGTGDDLVKSFYAGCLEYLQQPNEYLFSDVFPDAKLVQTNADTKTINLKSKSRFPTIMCRSIDARQVGLSEATNLLYMDDCVEGREEAKNRARLDQKWEIISGDIMGRAIEGTPMVFTGTRYSLYDPIGRIQEHAQKEGWNWRAIEIPALDLITDESNYEYTREGKKVFTTAFFREQRELLSAEQFESEFQQQPFEAKGLLYNKADLNYYFELPADRDPDAIVAFCDTAESGEDSTAMVILKLYGEDVYVDDVVFDNGLPTVTKPQCAKKLVEHRVSEATFESNAAGSYFARDVHALVKSLGGNIAIRTKRTITNKQTRMEFASDGVKKHFFFKHHTTYDRGSQYWSFMQEVTTYTRTGKVPHDDAPDVLSLAENALRLRVGAKVEIVARPF